MRIASALLLIAFGSVPGLAQDVPLPRERPEPPTLAEMAGTAVNVPLPRARPDIVQPSTAPVPAAPPTRTAAEDAMVPPALGAAPEPVLPPEPTPPVEPSEPRAYQVACPAVMSGRVVAEALPPIVEGQCGLQSPLSLSAIRVNGRTVPLNAPVTVDCGVATVLPDWLEDIDAYVTAHDNTEVTELIVGTNYMCRNVDNAATGNLSFHAFADALDVVGFKLDDGRSITVEPAWTGTEAEGSRIIRFAHDSACTHFTTVLGPEANALHHDHLHVDLGCHGKTCTARLCE